MKGANDFAGLSEVFIELSGTLEGTFNEYLRETIHLGQISALSIEIGECIITY